MCAEYEPTKEVGFPHCVVLYVLSISPWLLSGCCVQNPCVSGRLFLAALVASIPTLGRCRRHRLCQFRIWTTRMTLETWDPSCIWSEWQKDRNSKKAKKESLLFWCQGSFTMFSFQHPQVSLHPACVAGWTASLQPCSVQSATLLQSQIWTQLPYTLDQAPMFTRLLLHCCWSGSNNPASQFPGWEGGVSVGEVQLQWNGLKAGPNSATWRRSRRIRGLQDEASVHIV